MNKVTVMIDYTNHRGERRWRRVTPRHFAFISSHWHRADGFQWIMVGTDEETGQEREFAMKNIHGWRPVE